MDLIMEPVTDSGFKAPSSSSGTVSSGDDWEPLSPTAQVQSKEFLNEMDLTDEGSWEEDFKSSGECFTTALKTDDKVDWEWTDWMRPDRLYAQARRRENDRRTGNKYTMTQMTERMQNLTTVNGLSCNGSGGYQTAGTSKRKAVKRDWFGNEIFHEDDWSYCFAAANHYNDKEETALKCIRV